jgi:hypothetical protein
MGLMMWMMNRGQDKTSGQDGQAKQEVERLRSEIDQLKAERAAKRGEGTF